MWRIVWTASRTEQRQESSVFQFIRCYCVMNVKFGEVAYTLHSNCDVWSPNLKKSLMCGLCRAFIVVSMSKLRNPTGEEAGQKHTDGEENNGDGGGSENVQEEHASRSTELGVAM